MKSIPFLATAVSCNGTQHGPAKRTKKEAFGEEKCNNKSDAIQIVLLKRVSPSSEHSHLKKWRTTKLCKEVL